MEITQQITRKVKNWLEKIPALTRLILLISFFSYLIYILISLIQIYIHSGGHRAVTFLKVWQIYMVPYTNFISYLTELAIYYLIANSTEKKLGTARYSIFVIVNLFLTEFIHYLLYSLINFILKDFMLNFRNMIFPGLWGLIMTDLIIKYNKNPEKQEHWFISLNVKSKYVPYIYFFSISLLFPVVLKLLSGLIIGYLYVYHKLDFLTISDMKAEDLERANICSWLKNMPNFIRVSAIEKEEHDEQDHIDLGSSEYSNSSITSTSLDNEYELLEETDKILITA
ncbi:unnamed protein product [Blepharisma stoltei]|uniref:Uncharacterized protein n=1 Tax=Blepharisma stoltei TaxID=1481888 RepID=A0AAU9K295_9CILI|nr:unnamed protein product [Blepharisma stoltei]